MADKPKEKKSLIVWDVIGPAVMFVIILVIATLAVLIIGALVTGINDYETLFFFVPSLSLWVNILFYGFSIFWLGRLYKNDDLRFGERKLCWPAWKVISAVVLGTGISVLLNLLISLSHLHEIFPSYDAEAAVSFAGQNAVLLILATVILGPMAEEIVFRGLVFQRMRQYLGPVPCMVISALLFGLYHMNMVQFIYTSCIGIMLAFLYEKSGSLIVPVLTHAAMNLVALHTYF